MIRKSYIFCFRVLKKMRWCIPLRRLSPRKVIDMACSIAFIEDLCQILSPLGEVRCRKMMGDYVIYVNEKCVITACDNLAYVKKLPCIEALMADAKTEIPYSGAKEAYILDLSNRSTALKVVDALWEVLPFPKSKIKKNI